MHNKSCDDDVNVNIQLTFNFGIQVDIREFGKPFVSFRESSLHSMTDIARKYK